MKTKYFIGITLLVFVLLFIGCTEQASTEVSSLDSTTDIIAQETAATETIEPQERTPEPPTISKSQETGITLDEVLSHDSRQDCWTVVDGKVYDVTEFIDEHEGGPSILQGCGTDASDIFASKHGGGARANLDNYYLDDLR